MGKNEYQRLPMGICNSQDIFQEQMGELIADLEFAKAYIDGNSSWQKTHGKVIITIKICLCQIKSRTEIHINFLENLNILDITRDGIKPIPKKVQAIIIVKTPTITKKQQRHHWYGYRDMWVSRSEILAPLASLTSKFFSWKWNKEYEDCYN